MESDLAACLHLTCTCSLSFFLPSAPSEDPCTLLPCLSRSVLDDLQQSSSTNHGLL